MGPLISHRRRGTAKFPVILLLVAAVLGGTFLAWSAQAGSPGAGPRGHRHGHEAVGGRSGLGSVDLTGWAKEQVASDKERRARPQPRTAVSPTPAKSGAVTAVRQAGFVRAAAEVSAQDFFERRPPCPQLLRPLMLRD